MQKHNVNKDILLYTEDKYFNDEQIRNDINLLEGLLIRINLKGKGQYQSLISDYNMQIKESETTLDLIRPDEGVAKINNYTHQKFASILIPNDFLKANIPLDKYTQNFYNDFEYEQNIKNLSQKKTNPKTQALALDILNNPYMNNLDKLYTESKVLDIIYTEFTNLFKEKEPYSAQTIKFSNQDKEALYYAKEILISNISNPPSLKELSYKVKLNEFKLKIGFNKFFNQTPYSISIESRLQESKKLLEKSEYNINEITSKVGYKYAQSFSSAFFKRFGIRPKDLMKNRKYYY